MPVVLSLLRVPVCSHSEPLPCSLVLLLQQLLLLLAPWAQSHSELVLLAVDLLMWSLLCSLEPISYSPEASFRLHSLPAECCQDKIGSASILRP